MIAHLDCSSGISGDKFLGALIDAGFAAADLRAALEPLGIPTERMRVERVTSYSIAASSVTLLEDDTGLSRWRRLSDVRELLDRSTLPDEVRSRAMAAFELLAEAEAHVHGVAIEEVHFHEIGALDTVLDVVGVALGLHALGVEKLIATPPALGDGTVETSHGVLPVPAPATAHLLVGVPVTTGPTRPDGTHLGELTTPTGAALLRVFADEYGPVPPMTPRATGYGAGSRDIGSPNVARILIGEPVGASSDAGATAATTPPDTPLELETVTLLETNIDHLTPEQLAFCAEELLAQGALDVWQTPIVMKKGRAAVSLSVMCTPADAVRLGARVHALTGSLGVRRRDIERTVLPREEQVVTTRYGDVRVKTVTVGGKTRAKPEHDEVARIARETDKAIALVAEELAFDIAEAF